jgi:hypothetical protein
MPEGFEDYLRPVVQLCKAAGALFGTAFMTVDEKVVEAGKSQRKPHPHVDGCFISDRNHWGHNGWLQTCNDIQKGPIGRMAVIVASSVPGCKAWKGVFDAVPKEDGDLSHVHLTGGEVLPPSVGYVLSPDCIHESMLMLETVKRTFLRIALPLDYAF